MSKGGKKMQEYQVYHRDGNYTISGDTLVDAVEANFGIIAQRSKIGNVAGYMLDEVWMEYENESVKLHIISHGSDGLVQYDPLKDTPKEKIVDIKADINDCPKRHYFELKENKTPFDPFGPLQGSGALFGTAKAMMDWVAEHGCAETQYMMSSFVHPTACHSQPYKALLLMLNRLNHLHPKKDATTQKIMDRITELVDEFCKSEEKHIADSYPIFYYKTMAALEKRGKVTALSKLRKKAGLTQQELADKVGISLRQLNRYEDKDQSSLGTAKYSIIVALAEAVNAKSQDLVKNGVVIMEYPK